MASGTSAVVLLAVLLALGFLLEILSCALFANWLPLLSGGCSSADVAGRVLEQGADRPTRTYPQP